MRYIDADALKDWSEIVPLTGDGGIDINDFDEKLASMPAADVAPVRHGRWVRQSDRTKPLYGWNICSECGAVLGSVAPYCSECGAQMVDNETAFNRWAKSVADSYRKNGGDGE